MSAPLTFDVPYAGNPFDGKKEISVTFYLLDGTEVTGIFKPVLPQGEAVAEVVPPAGAGDDGTSIVPVPKLLVEDPAAFAEKAKGLVDRLKAKLPSPETE